MDPPRPRPELPPRHPPLVGNTARPGSLNDMHDRPGKRRLLLIYIHGFMGNERSFQDFPQNVHNLVTTLVSDTHIVHTKLYPRYHSKRNIALAGNDFSQWLSPNESDDTDVVLLGHSMGGLVAADVALMKTSGLKHRIIGCIYFDVPFLGMHPRIVKSGLRSLFAPKASKDVAQDPPDRPPPSADDGDQSSAGSEVAHDSHNSQPRDNADEGVTGTDPTFDPVFPNDVQLPNRRGWEKVFYFVTKHSDGLYNGAKNLVAAHMEFGGAMADYSGLKRRYTSIRTLDDPDAVTKAVNTGDASSNPRVRFVNYYTASTGRPKRRKSSTSVTTPKPEQDRSISPADRSDYNLAEAKVGDGADVVSQASPEVVVEQASPTTGTEEPGAAEHQIESLEESSQTTGPSSFSELAEGIAALSTSSGSEESSSTNLTEDVPKEREFCALPPRDHSGNRDPCWVRVLMKDIDEVTAHCGLFFHDCPAYPYLVGDVAARIKDWLQDAATEQTIRNLMNE